LFACLLAHLLGGFLFFFFLGGLVDGRSIYDVDYWSARPLEPNTVVTLSTGMSVTSSELLAAQRLRGWAMQYVRQKQISCAAPQAKGSHSRLPVHRLFFFFVLKGTGAT
jgi:hypothetical protein